MKYTVKQLRADFPDDQACLEWLVEYLYPRGITCVRCNKVTNHTKIVGRRAYACSCGQQIYPLAGTIFHRSTTPLTDWFHAIYLMSTNKAGTSAKQIQRELGVTYKCAWRMMHMIRTMMESPDDPLENEVEIDETYIHPNTFKRSSAQKRYGRDARRKGEIVFGMVQRGGNVKVWHVPSAGARVVQPIIRDNVVPYTRIHTDGYMAYRSLPKFGFEHRWTDHGRGEYYTPHSSTQNIENVWSHLKRGIKGVYRHIGPLYIQLYANEYAWRYNHRGQPVLFWDLLSEVSLRAPVSGPE